MKILFVYRGYGERGTNSVIDFQRSSLMKEDVEVDTFQVRGGGMKTYITAIFQLGRYIKKNPVDVVHAHFSFSGFIAGLATRKPVVCSLMGSDVLKTGKLFKVIAWFFYKYVWTLTIVKSKEMQKAFPEALVIPNGVDFSNFRPVQREEALRKTGFDAADHNIIFVAEAPESTVKNLALATAGIKLLSDEKAKLHLVSGKGFTELPYYYSAADVLLLTSLSEGSPNVVKEAMACNCPIVTTEVGDVRNVLGSAAGCFITNFVPQDVADKLRLVLAFGKRTNGREAIQVLDSRLIAKRIIAMYKDLLHSKNK